MDNKLPSARHTRHSPGPWKLVNQGQHVQAPRRPGSRAQHDIDICSVEFNELEFAGQFEANGRLIAAAPELLEALGELLATQPEVLAPIGKLYDAVSKAKMAVARATGERS